jgi:hypothetical protein
MKNIYDFCNYEKENTKQKSACNSSNFDEVSAILSHHFNIFKISDLF